MTRWTFFRVKLVFEYDFEISCLGLWVLGIMDFETLGLWDPGTLGILDFRTFGPLPSSTTSLYFLLRPLSQMTIELICEKISMIFHSQKFYGGGGGGWHCISSYNLQVQVSLRFEIDNIL